ncbi:ubiquitin-conjugating enzyme E2 [Trypanosoma rangeli]|uniref:Ubiquitin-conjugating enzyme E2 n=1 Tax=Trypanosoma rangeli TaxID=5698 RepID=A0A3R7ND33_TRYRA|nr:ubiquitin-conjugating enzyme E2 [Trypanosoma rangeli]RNF04636.1 ubiquitin-conjugating enzyme E2 [Trypanosoma rangeli]|eukprot:RNF04636.1 ubiquitin-conjugating enzyme E2 [Trypanosoma rangeli]
MPNPPTPQCVRRLQKEYSALCREIDPLFFAIPSAKSILHWYFIINGPVDTPYEGGRYFGRLNFPPEYPMKPPEIIMLTPTGRFEVNMAICLTMSNYHPENWSPLWGIRTILTGLLSFMAGEEYATGCMVCSDAQRRKYARESRRFNVEQMTLYKQLFPEEYEKDSAALKGESHENNGSMCKTDGHVESCGADAKTEGAIGLQEEQWSWLSPMLLSLFAVAIGAYFWLW